MIKVYVKKQSNFPVSTTKIKKKLSFFFKTQGMVSDSDVSVTIVGENSMKGVARKYLDEANSVHSVLSFPFDEVKEKFIDPPDNIIHLGEIIICYPVAQKEANKEQKMIEDKVYELIEHGAMHLLGKHHE